MKKTILTIGTLFLSITTYAQWLGNNPLTTNSNVGIGTLNPQAKLHIESGITDNAAVLATSIENNKLMVSSFFTAPLGSKTFQVIHEFETNRNNGFINFHRGSSYDGGFLTFGTHGQERLRIDPIGNVGIGTLNPQAKLHIESGITDNAAVLATSTENNKLVVSSFFTSPLGAKTFQVIHEFETNRNNGFINFHRGSSYDGGFLTFGTYGEERLRITAEGNLGIGTTKPSCKLDVCGTIRANEVKVDLNCGADFVFKEDYQLMDLKTVEEFIKVNQHLPEIASEKQMIEEGIEIKAFQIQLLQKIEELTLYIIEQNKSIETLKTTVKEQNQKIEALKSVEN